MKRMHPILILLAVRSLFAVSICAAIANPASGTGLSSEYPAKTAVIPIGDTLTVIQRPLLNIPAIVLVGDTLPIECDADPATTGWTASIRRGSVSIPLTIVAESYDPSTLWWTLSAVVPPVPVYDLFDLIVGGTGIETDTTRHAVKVISGFRDDYYFLQISDTHLPTHKYYYESGWANDTTEIEDLRAVIDDIRYINPEFVLITGDYINEGELEEYLGARYFTRAQKLLTEFDVPVYLVSGNHDIGGWSDTPPPDGTARREWWRFFGWKRLDSPPSGAPWYTQNYSFDYGSVRYIGLEAYINYDNWRSSIYGGESFRTAQFQWLQDEIASSSGSASHVLFYHYDFSSQIDLGALGADMALWGHIHSSSGSIASPPFDLAIAKVCDGERAYRMVRVSNGTLTPLAPLSAGLSGSNLDVVFTPANDGTNLSVQAEITNNQGVRFENGLVRFVMPKDGGNADVTGGTLLQVDRSGSTDVYDVGVDIQPSGTQTVTIDLGSTVVEEGSAQPVPRTLALGWNYPNPFNPATNLRFDLPEAARVDVTVFDSRGREVRTLLDAPLAAGRHTVGWNGEDRDGNAAPSGIYLVRLRAGGEVRTRKIVLAR